MLAAWSVRAGIASRQIIRYVKLLNYEYVRVAQAQFLSVCSGDFVAFFTGVVIFRQQIFRRMTHNERRLPLAKVPISTSTKFGPKTCWILIFLHSG